METIGRRPELVLLDVQAPSLIGFEVLARLEVVPRVIFSTACNHYAVNAFEADAVDYLLKPHDRARQAEERALHHLAAGPDEKLQRLLLQLQAAAPLMPAAAPLAYPPRLFVPQRPQLVAVPVESICYAEATGDYCTLHTGTGRHLSNLGISLRASSG